ncbi:MAG: hypothetical protein GY757_29580, partial [bacterium]|nr:hypothetical protein [bacterium]
TPGYLYCASAGGTNLIQKICKKSAKVEKKGEFPFRIHEIKKLSENYMIAKCSGDNPGYFLAVIDFDLVVADIIENLPVPNMTLAVIDKNRVLIMAVAEMTALKMFDYSVKDKKIVETMEISTAEPRSCRCVLLHEDLYYIGGDGFFMCLDEKLETVSDNVFKGKIKGPVNPFVKGNIPLELTFKLTVDRE